MSLGRPGEVFAARVDHSGSRRPPLRRCRCLLVLILHVSLLVILPLAVASLPDPLWIGGVYDGGDYDDLISLSGDVVLRADRPFGRATGLGMAWGSPVRLSDPVLTAASGLLVVDAVAPASRARPSAPTRAPPRRMVLATTHSASSLPRPETATRESLEAVLPSVLPSLSWHDDSLLLIV
jgi:hypothetical protein